MLNFTGFKGLLGITSPALYLAHADADGFDDFGDDLVTKTVGTTTYYARPRYDVQANYEEVETLYGLIESTIKVKPYTLSLRDKIVDPAKGLTLTGVTIQVNTNDTNKTATSASEDWADLITWNTDGSTVFTPAKGINGASIAVDRASNVVQGVISNVDFQVWTRVNINVVVTPRPLVLESHSATWPYDGDSHRYNVIKLNEGSLVNGDTLTTNTTATITHIAESVKPNAFDWNITVDVKVPLDPSQYVIHYSTNYQDSATECTTEPFIYTNVTDTIVFYWVKPVGPNKDDYIPGTGYARVQITPAPVTVTADDVTVLQSDPKPETYTATLRRSANPIDEQMRRIWITVRLPPGMQENASLAKIVILQE